MAGLFISTEPPQVPEPSQNHVRSSSRARSRGPGPLMYEPFPSPGLIPGPVTFYGQPGVYPGPGPNQFPPGVYRGPGPNQFPPGVYRGPAAFAVPRFPGPRGRQPRKMAPLLVFTFLMSSLKLGVEGLNPVQCPFGKRRLEIHPKHI